MCIKEAIEGKQAKMAFKLSLHFISLELFYLFISLSLVCLLELQIIFYSVYTKDF